MIPTQILLSLLPFLSLTFAAPVPFPLLGLDGSPTSGIADVILSSDSNLGADARAYALCGSAEMKYPCNALHSTDELKNIQNNKGTPFLIARDIIEVNARAGSAKRDEEGTGNELWGGFTGGAGAGKGWKKDGDSVGDEKWGGFTGGARAGKGWKRDEDSVGDERWGGFTGGAGAGKGWKRDDDTWDADEDSTGDAKWGGFTGGAGAGKGWKREAERLE